MKKRFTILITAAFMLLTMMASTGTMWGQTYTLVSNLSGIEGGTYCIAAFYSNKYYTVPNTTISGQTFTCTEATYTNNVLTPASGHGEFVFTPVSNVSNAYYIYNTNLKKYLVATGSKTFGYVDNTSNDYGYWTFSTVTSGGFSGVFSVQHSNKTHYMRAYNNSVRCYDSQTNQGVYLFVQNATSDPTISASAVNIAYNATEGSIAYTINNPVSGGALTASTESDWLNFGTVTSTTVPFSCEANPTAAERAAMVTLTYTYNTNETVTKNVTVTQAGNPNAPGTENNPYTVAQARAAIDAGTGVTGVYATGIVSEIVTAYGTGGYNNVTFNMVDEAGDEVFLQAYRCVGDDAPNVLVGDIAVVTGNLTKYGQTYEFASGCSVVSLEHPSTPYITANDVEITYNATAGSIAYTVENPVQGGQLTAATTSTWLTLSNTFTSPIAFTCDANEAAASRTATVTLTYTYGAKTIVNKDITVTQAGSPEVYNNISDITAVGTTYSVKGTVVAINSRGFVMGDGTGYVYYYKNGAVSQSVGDMVTVAGTTGTYGQIIQFTNTATVGEATTSSYNNTPAAEVITAVPDYSTGYHLSTYLEFEGALAKSSGNYLITVGESQIQISYPTTDQGTALTALVDKTVHVKGYFSGINSSSKFTVMLESAEEVVIPSITVNPTSVEAPADETEGTITVTLTAIANNDIEVQWFESDGTTAATYNHDWILTDVNTDKNIDYVIGANTGAARTAYFKVYGMDGEANDVYSDLVTISQAAYVAPTPSIAVTPTLVEATADETQGTITVTLTAIANNEIEVQWFESDGTTAATYNHDWVLTDVNTDKNIDYVIGANTGAARTAYFKVYGMDGEANDVYSELVTISQAAYVPPVQTENYELFSGNLVEGDYLIVYDDGAMNTTLDNSNRLQFVEVEPNNDVISTNNAEIVWHIAPSGEYWTIYNADADKYAAGTGAKNKIQLLDDATTNNALWTVTGTTTYEFVNKANSDASVNANLRRNGDYGFACYSTSTGGALSLYKKIDNTPSITINPGPYNLNADGGNAVLPVTTSNLATDPQLAVVFYESDGVTPTTYDWISAEINGDGNVAGHIDANTGEARSAYFKVSGLANDNTTTVYSDLVTVNQAAYALSIVFETTVLNIEVGGEQDRIISFEYQGLGENPTFEVRQYDATGETQTTYDWFTTTITQEHKVNITVAANTGAARSGYFKVYGYNSTVNTESNLVTINQAAVPAPVINANDIEIGYDATSGEIAYTITNPTTATLTATATEEWISNITVTTDKVTFSSTINEGNTNRIGTITLSYEGAENKAVTVTQGHQIVDYATLPFEWAGGASADFLALAGVSAYGLGSDYGSTHSPYNIKFDDTNDYIQVKTDSQPAKVTIGVKMIGGGNTSYINIQESSDGTNFTNVQELTISGSSNDIVNLATTEDFASTTRYVRMVFTKGSNVGVGPIAITKYTTDPIINAEDVNITCDATNGSIAYTISNPVVGGVLTASTTSEWLVLGSVTTSVPFTCTANTTEENRSATVTLTYTYNTSETVTKDVTVTQSKRDYATMPFAFDGGRNDIENTAGLTQDGLDTDYSSSPKLKFNTEGDWIILKLNAAPVSLSYDIKGNGFSGGTFKVQTSANGTEYNDLATYTTLGDVQSVTHIDLDASVHYIKWVYTNKDKGNVALGNIHATEHYDTYGDVTLNDLNLTASSESLIVHSGSVVTLTGTVTNDSPDNLIIEDGGQIIHDNAGVKATVKKSITGYGTGTGNYYLLVTPFTENIDPASVTNMIAATPADYDLYQWNSGEAEEWRNYKQGTFTLNNGIGYLYANKNNVELTFTGTLKQSNTVVTVNPDYLTADFGDWTLVGNPFPCKAYIIDASSSMAFYRMKSTGDGFETATGAIKPMEGIFVQTTEENQSFKFTREAPVTSPGKGNLNINVAQVVNSRDAQPVADNAIIRFDGGNNLKKFSFREDNTKVYIPQNGKDYAVVNAQAQGEMPVNFKAAENGTYTIDFSMDNVEFSYLHLIDNKTGMDIDLLQTSSYTFEASKIDYASRFKLVFSTNNNSNSNDDNSFAFFDANGNLMILGIEGTATLQVIDITGRAISNETFSGNYSKAINAKAGVYMLRLIQGNDVRTQKIVVR